MRSLPLNQKSLPEKHNLVFEDLGYFIHHSTAAKNTLLLITGQLFLNLRSPSHEFLLTLLAVSRNLLALAGLLSFNKGLLTAVMQLQAAN